MSTQTQGSKTQKQFLNIPDAARQFGYSSRHFRRIIEENRIPVLHMGRKFFVLSRDLEAWKSTRSGMEMTEAFQTT
jgi:excisionase family DNA binding protein